MRGYATGKTHYRNMPFLHTRQVSIWLIANFMYILLFVLMTVTLCLPAGFHIGVCMHNMYYVIPHCYAMCFIYNKCHHSLLIHRK